MRKISIVISVVITIVCAVSANAETPLQPLTVQLNWIPNVEFAGVLIAKERGWYQEAGLDVTVKGWEAGVSPIEDVLAGKAQVGVAEGANIIEMKVQGKAITAIAAPFQKPAYCLLSKKTQGIEKPEQFRGKRIGIGTPDSILMTKIVLANAGIKYEDITPVQVGLGMEAFMKDEIDVLAAFMNIQPLLLKEQGFSEFSYLPAFKYGYDFYSGVYFASDEMLKQQPELLLNFTKATMRGWQEAFQDPEASAKLIVEKYAPKESVLQQIESLKLFRTLAMLGEGKKFLGWMDTQIWTKGIDLLYNFHEIDRKIPATDVFTKTFLESIYFGKK